MRYNPLPVKRLLRILLNALTVLSPLLCVAVAVFWVRGHSTADWIALRSDSRAYHLISARGEIIVLTCARPWAVGAEKRFAWGSYPAADGPGTAVSAAETFWSRIGIVSVPTRVPVDLDPAWAGKVVSADVVANSHNLRVPNWAILVAILLALHGKVRRVLRQKVRRRGTTHLCRTCGYDLRATPDRCPEMFSLPQVAAFDFFAPCCSPSSQGSG
jgi:hypothetical protein